MSQTASPPIDQTKAQPKETAESFQGTDKKERKDKLKNIAKFLLNVCENSLLVLLSPLWTPLAFADELLDSPKKTLAITMGGLMVLLTLLLASVGSAVIVKALPSYLK